MPVSVRGIDDLMTELAERLVTNASIFQLSLLPNSMNQADGHYLFSRSFMDMLVEIYRKLAELEADGNPISMTGRALDLFVNTFGIFRVEGTAAHGNLVVQPRTLGNTGTAFSGLVIAFNDDINYVVTADTVLSPTTHTLVPVEAINVGSEGDLPAGTEMVCQDPSLEADFRWRVGDQGLDVGGTPIGRLFGGTDYELDDSLRERFFQYLQSLSRATVIAVVQAINSISGLVSISFSNIDPLPGFFTVYVDDGSVGVDPEQPSLTADNRTRIQAVLDEWQAAGVVGRIKPIRKQLTNITVSILVDANYANTLTVTNPVAAIEDDVEARLTAYLSNIPRRSTVYLSRLYDIAHNAPGVLKVTFISPTSDIVPSNSAAVRPGTVSVSGTVATS